MSNRIQQLNALGQSVWCDDLSRRAIDSGELQAGIDRGIVGVTSNPTIFMKAITAGHDYDAALTRMPALGAASDRDVYEGLVLPDIRDAADLLRAVYDRTDGLDGFVSLEVSPRLAYDTQGTVEEALRLFEALDRPNVMIKVPATREGIPAIETLIGRGVNVNVTLIFALEMYRQVMEAYLRGLKRRIETGADVSRVASVASFFVSRVDTVVDKRLEDLKKKGRAVDGLFGQAAIANAKLAYAVYQETFHGGPIFTDLRARGARPQRPLWASTSAKNPAYPDTLYVDGLIGPETVNTIPPATIEAFLDHGKVERTLDENVEHAKTVVERLEALGVSLRDVTEYLLQQGVELFAASFEELMASLTRKKTLFART